MRIAVLAPNKPFWGARIVQIPFFRTLRELHPEAVIRVHSPVDETVDFVPWGLADEHRTYGRRSLYRLPTDLWKWWPDLVFNLRRKSFGCTLSTATAPRGRTGYAEGLLSHAFHTRVPYDSRIYLAARYTALATGAAADWDDASIPAFRRWMDAQLGTRTDPEAASSVLLFPGAGNREKRWPLDRFLEVAEALRRDEGRPCLFVFGPAEDAGAVQDVEARGFPVLASPARVELLGLIRSAALVISNDNGPSHLAQLSGRRFLGLYRAGWSTVEDWFLDKPNSELLVTGLGEGLDTLEAARVLDAARAVLERGEQESAFTRFTRTEAERPRAGMR